MILPKVPDLCLLLVRTDYADDAAWNRALAAATAVYDSYDFDHVGANFWPVESPELAGLTANELRTLTRAGYLSAIAVADAQTMKDHTILLVDLNELYGEPGRTFRSVPEEAEAIVANLSLANMNFAEFADRVEADGVFRGF
jgi:hypothetical protein